MAQTTPDQEPSRYVYQFSGSKVHIWVVERESDKCLFLRKCYTERYRSEYRLHKKKLDNPEWNMQLWSLDPQEVVEQAEAWRKKEIRNHERNLENLSYTLNQLEDHKETHNADS